MTRNSGSTANDLGLLVLRVGFASLLIGLHGWARLGRASNYVFFGQQWTFVANVVEKMGFPFPGFFAVMSALSESVGALLVGLGLFTRIGALFVTISFSVAVFSEHSHGDPIELPALYLLIAATLLFTGGGTFSLGRVIRSIRKKK